MITNVCYCRIIFSTKPNSHVDFNLIKITMNQQKGTKGLFIINCKLQKCKLRQEGPLISIK